MGLLSIYMIQDKLEERVSKPWANAIVAAVIALTGFGIYLGRFLRWNSWDILLNPEELMRDILQMVIHPFGDLQPLGVTLSFTVLFFICYRTFYILINHRDHETQQK